MRNARLIATFGDKSGAAGTNILATVRYPDGNPSVNVAQFARDAMSPFVNVG